MKEKHLDINHQFIKQFVESIRPADIEIRKKLDVGFSWDKNIALLFEIRPRWDNPDEVMQNEFSKIRYVKASNEWKLYWMRANGNWEAYEPFSVGTNIQELLEVVREDKYGCFFG